MDEKRYSRNEMLYVRDRISERFREVAISLFGEDSFQRILIYPWTLLQLRLGLESIPLLKKGTTLLPMPFPTGLVDQIVRPSDPRIDLIRISRASYHFNSTRLSGTETRTYFLQSMYQANSRTVVLKYTFLDDFLYVPQPEPFQHPGMAESIITMDVEDQWGIVPSEINLKPDGLSFSIAVPAKEPLPIGGWLGFIKAKNVFILTSTNLDTSGSETRYILEYTELDHFKKTYVGPKGEGWEIGVDWPF
ncbi:MAG: hypothetical protein RTU63_03540 [Candidatus Thorarchaeota archaeon]